MRAVELRQWRRRAQTVRPKCHADVFARVLALPRPHDAAHLVSPAEDRIWFLKYGEPIVERRPWLAGGEDLCERGLLHLQA